MSLPLEMLDHDGNSTRVEKSLNLGPIGYLEYSGNCSSAVNEDNPEVCEKSGPDVCEKFGLDVANSSNEPIKFETNESHPAFQHNKWEWRMLVESSEFDDSSDENYIISDNEVNIDSDVFVKNKGTGFVGSIQGRNKVRKKVKKMSELDW